MVDFEGQKLMETYFQNILRIAALLGVIIGFIFQSFAIAFYILAFGVVISAAIVLPDWPYFNRQNLKWLAPLVNEADALKKTISQKKRK